MTQVKKTDVKIPETTFTDWSIVTCDLDKEMRDAHWSREPGAEEGTAVAWMTIHRIEDSSTNERRLLIFTDESAQMLKAAPARTVDLGEDVDCIEDAVMKVVRLGAAEAGRTEKQPMRVYVHYSGTETRHIEEVSPEVAASVAVLALSDGDPEFFETLKDFGGKDYDMETIEATPDRPGVWPW